MTHRGGTSSDFSSFEHKIHKDFEYGRVLCGKYWEEIGEITPEWRKVTCGNCLKQGKKKSKVRP